MSSSLCCKTKRVARLCRTLRCLLWKPSPPRREKRPELLRPPHRPRSPSFPLSLLTLNPKTMTSTLRQRTTTPLTSNGVRSGGATGEDEDPRPLQARAGEGRVDGGRWRSGYACIFLCAGLPGSELTRFFPCTRRLEVCPHPHSLIPHATRFPVPLSAFPPYHPLQAHSRHSRRSPASSYTPPSPSSSSSSGPLTPRSPRS